MFKKSLDFSVCNSEYMFLLIIPPVYEVYRGYIVIPPVYEVYRGYIVFAFSVCVCVCV